MEHLVQFTISLDDYKIKQHIYESAVKDITEKLIKDVEKSLFQHYGYGNVDPDRDDLSKFCRDVVKECFKQHEDVIIEKAIKELVKSFSRTKKVKNMLEKLESTIDD